MEIVYNVAKRLLPTCHRANKSFKSKVIPATTGVIIERQTPNDTLKEGDSLCPCRTGVDWFPTESTAAHVEGFATTEDSWQGNPRHAFMWRAQFWAELNRKDKTYS